MKLLSPTERGVTKNLRGMEEGGNGAVVGLGVSMPEGRLLSVKSLK